MHFLQLQNCPSGHYYKPLPLDDVHNIEAIWRTLKLDRLKKICEYSKSPHERRKRRQFHFYIFMSSISKGSSLSALYSEIWLKSFIYWLIDWFADWLQSFKKILTIAFQLFEYVLRSACLKSEISLEIIEKHYALASFALVRCLLRSSTSNIGKK